MKNKKVDLSKCNLDFLKGTIYKDMRFLGENVFGEIKAGISKNNCSALVENLSKYSRLLKNYTVNDKMKKLSEGVFSSVYIIKNDSQDQIVIKKSHETVAPLLIFKELTIPIPKFIINMLFDDFDICVDSLKRDVHDYEDVIKPYWGKSRKTLHNDELSRYLNLALYMVDEYIPKFTADELHTKRFWNKLLEKDRHPLMDKLEEHIKKYKDKELIPEEERFVFYEKETNSLQTIFIQKASIGTEEILPDKYTAYPFELVAEGVIFDELPKLMLDHMITAVYAFVEQLNKFKMAKVPDYRPYEGWKLFPPSPYEMHLAETNNLMVYKSKKGDLFVKFIDTHILFDREANQIFKWIEKRYWISLFLNIRFWMKKIIKKIN